MAEIRHLENRHDVIFFWRGWSNLDKFCRLVGNDLSTAVMWSKSKPDVEFQYAWTFGRIQWHVIPEPRIALQGAATWWIHCQDPRATCHIAGCSHLVKSISWSCHIAMPHIENRFSPYFIFLWFLMQFRPWQAVAFVSSPIHLLA